MNQFFRQNKNNSSGYTVVELIIVVGMISIFSGLALPSFLNWIRLEKVNAYTRELREYFRVVRLNARRWGSSCEVDTNLISYNGVPNDRNYYGFSVLCRDNSQSINALAPAINNSIGTVNYRVEWGEDIQHWLSIDLSPEAHSWCEQKI